MRTHDTSLLICAAVFLLCLPPLPVHATIIDTTTNWIGGGVSGFGEGATGIFGQTFTTPADDTNLTSFTFWLADFLTAPYSPDYVHFAAYVMEWEDNADYTRMHATGDILWQSAERSTTNNNGQGGWEEFTFETGGLQLEPLTQYVLFLSSLAFNDGVPGYASMGRVPNTLDQEFFVAKQGGAVTSTGWTRFAEGDDAAVRISLSAPVLKPIPEPSTVFLVGGGITISLGLRLRRRKGSVSSRR